MMSCNDEEDDDEDEEDVSEEDSEDDDGGVETPVFCAAKNLQAAVFLEAGRCLVLAKNIKIKCLQVKKEKQKIKAKVNK